MKEGDALYFQIPDHHLMKAAIVKSVPSSWGSISGRLSAPGSMVIAGEVSEHTGIEVSRFRDVQVIVEPRSERVPDYVGILGQKVLPGFIVFDHAGFMNSQLPFETAREIAICFLLKGFGGSLRFYRDFIRDEMFQNSARCGMEFDPWKGPPFLKGETGRQPARIEIEWFPKNNGTPAMVEPIVNACRSLNFVEYSPFDSLH